MGTDSPRRRFAEFTFDPIERGFARDVRRTLLPGGRVGILDFVPGAMPHLGGDHGVGPDAVISAFAAAGFTVRSRDDQWGGRTYLVVLRAPS